MTAAIRTLTALTLNPFPLSRGSPSLRERDFKSTTVNGNAASQPQTVMLVRALTTSLSWLTKARRTVAVNW